MAHSRKVSLVSVEISNLLPSGHGQLLLENMTEFPRTYKLTSCKCFSWVNSLKSIWMDCYGFRVLMIDQRWPSIHYRTILHLVPQADAMIGRLLRTCCPLQERPDVRDRNNDTHSMQEIGTLQPTRSPRKSPDGPGLPFSPDIVHMASPKV